MKPFFFIYCFCLPIHFILFDPALPFCFLLSFRIVCLAAPSLVRVDSFVLYSLICILLAVDHVQILCTVYHIKGRKLILSAVLSTPLSLLGNCTTNVCLLIKFDEFCAFKLGVLIFVHLNCVLSINIRKMIDINILSIFFSSHSTN